MPKRRRFCQQSVALRQSFYNCCGGSIVLIAHALSPRMLLKAPIIIWRSGLISSGIVLRYCVLRVAFRVRCLIEAVFGRRYVTEMYHYGHNEPSDQCRNSAIDILSIMPCVRIVFAFAFLTPIRGDSIAPCILRHWDRKRLVSSMLCLRGSRCIYFHRW